MPLSNTVISGSEAGDAPEVTGMTVGDDASPQGDAGCRPDVTDIASIEDEGIARDPGNLTGVTAVTRMQRQDPRRDVGDVGDVTPVAQPHDEGPQRDPAGSTDVTEVTDVAQARDGVPHRDPDQTFVARQEFAPATRWRSGWGEVSPSGISDTPPGDAPETIDDDIPLPDLPGPQESPAKLLVLARVLATLGPRVDDGSWLDPTAITVILAPPHLAKRVDGALHSLLPAGMRPYGGSAVLRNDADAGKSAKARFSKDIRAALERRDPVIVVIASPADLEPSLHAALPAPLPLAAVTPDMIRDVIEQVFPGEPPHPLGPDPDAGPDRLEDPARSAWDRVGEGPEPAGDPKGPGNTSPDLDAPENPASPVTPTRSAVVGTDRDEAAGSPSSSPVARNRSGKVPGPDRDRAGTAPSGPGPAPRLDLPDAASLARLTDDDILVAFRADTAAGAIAALHERVRLRAGRAVPTLDDIAGYGDAEAAARRLVADLGRWTRGEVPWRDMTRSLLLEGEPGTGKTFLARAIAASAGVPFHPTSLAEWQAAGHLGDTLRAMQTAFAAARAQVPAILFIDEIDSLGSRTGQDTHASNYRTQVINGLLAEIDGVRDVEGVVILGATNHVSALDPAIIRPGRFDTIVRVPVPGPEAVRRILAHHLGDEIPDADRARLVPLACGRSAAKIDGAIREARSRARYAGHPFSAADLEAVLRPALVPSADRAWRIAVHEAGHLIVGLRLTDGVPRRITATPDGGSVVFDWPAPPATRAEIEAHLALRLAGRAAEEAFLDAPSAGAGGDDASDLAHATDLALRLETQFALGASGLVFRRDPEAAMRADPELAARVTGHLEAALARAKAVLHEEAQAVQRIVEALVQRRVIEGEETLRAICNDAA